MTPALLILASCAVTFVITTGFLLFKGKFGQRGVVWIHQVNSDNPVYRDWNSDPYYTER